EHWPRSDRRARRREIPEINIKVVIDPGHLQQTIAIDVRNRSCIGRPCSRHQNRFGKSRDLRAITLISIDRRAVAGGDDIGATVLIEVYQGRRTKPEEASTKLP